MYPQQNSWMCGPYALKHALALLGVAAHENEIAKAARTRRKHGTDDDQLRRAARKYACQFPLVRRLDPERARRDMATYLRRGIPVLLCLDEWEHWVTIARQERGQFIVLDSMDNAVLSILPWPRLRKRWVYHEPDDYDREARHTYFDFHPVIPRFRVRTRPHLSGARVRHLRRAENRLISYRWNEYVADLMDLCRPRTPLSENVLSLGEFLRRHEKMILQQVNHWHGDVNLPAAARTLHHLRFVADTLGMVIPEKWEKRTIAGITALLTLWAEGEVNGEPLYPTVRPRRRRR